MDGYTTISSPLDAALSEARERYIARNHASRAGLALAATVMPGGNTRSALFYKPFPLVIARGEGAWLWDIDGHRYLDLLGEFTAGLYGHSNPVIREALLTALDGGLNLGGHNALEAELARLICDRFTSIERVRFANSGTEANLLNIMAALHFTGRKRVLVFEGGYHGGVLTFAHGPSPANVPHDFIYGSYNDIEGTRALIEANADQLAAVLVEPMLGAGGCIPADPAFLVAIREATSAAGALMILDEVMTSRSSGGGMQALLGLAPDLTSLGKYIGGGMSFGAFGGRTDVMAQFDPGVPGALPHAGTFNNNVMTMSAGIAGLSRLFPPATADALRTRGDDLRDRLNGLCRKAGVAMQLTGFGSVMNVHFTARPVRTPADAAGSDQRLRDLFFFDMVEAGIYLARRGLIALALPIGDAEIEQVVESVSAFIARRRVLLAG